MVFKLSRCDAKAATSLKDMCRAMCQDFQRYVYASGYSMSVRCRTSDLQIQVAVPQGSLGHRRGIERPVYSARRVGLLTALGTAVGAATCGTRTTLSIQGRRYIGNPFVGNFLDCRLTPGVAGLLSDTRWRIVTWLPRPSRNSAFLSPPSRTAADTCRTQPVGLDSRCA